MRRFLVFFTAVIFSRFLIRIHFFIKTGNKRMVILYLLGIIISGGILISFLRAEIIVQKILLLIVHRM